MKRWHLLFCFCVCYLLHFTPIKAQECVRVMFYNVENLFDTKNDSIKSDDEFLPDGFMRWTEGRYWQKLRNITKVITAVGGMHSPAVVGLCEVENSDVLYDLTKRSPLQAQGYDFIITDSPDERGIDVALLYLRHRFRLLNSTEYVVDFVGRDIQPTRNILHVTGQLVNLDTLDIFVCHLPSRSGGKLETEPARSITASLLKAKTDSLFSVRADANIIVMGDFNDNPNGVTNTVLGACHPGQQSDTINNSLYNLSYPLTENPEFGTYKYQGRWELFDQFIVSSNLLRKGSTTEVETAETQIFHPDFLLEEDNKYYGKKPYRTYLGPRYQGGFSDHLPIYIDLIIR